MLAKLFVEPSNYHFNKSLCVHVNFLLHKLCFLTGLLLHKLIAPLQCRVRLCLVVGRGEGEEA